MKKKLLMAAVGAALVAGPVAVQAGSTLYGHFHLSFDRLDNDNNQEVGQLANNSSRFGIKGDEDLGGGLKAIYQVESGTFAADEGTGGFNGTLRNTFVGFTGSWGTVKIGRHDTPFKELGRKLDDFNEQLGDARSLIGNAGALDDRVSNMVRYDSPKFAGGWQASFLHSSNNGADGAGNTSVKENSAGVTWSAGPLFLGLAWVEEGTSNPNKDQSGIRVVGSYSINNIELGLSWDSLSDLGGTSGADRDALGVYAAMKMGNNKLKFQWIDLDKIDNAASNNGADMWAIGVDHKLSKTVMLYANYAQTSNDTGGSFGVTSGPSGHDSTLSAATGKDYTGYTLGTIIKF